MDENTSVVEQTADQQDAFLSGWDDTESVEVVEDSAAPEEQAEAEESAAKDETPSEEPAAEPVEAKQEQAQQTQENAEAPLPKEWKIKHLGEEVTLNEAQITEYLQKGYDYDRIRQRYDESKGVMDLFGKFAKDAGMSVPDYVKYLRVEVKKNSGLTEDEAKREVALEDREAVVSAQEAAKAEEDKAKNDASARIQADLAEFSKAFPEVYEQAKKDPGTLPDSVWNDVTNNHLSLTAAYSRYAVAQAQAQAKTAEEAAAAKALGDRNGARSTGSLKSAGNGDKKDSFLSGFNS